VVTVGCRRVIVVVIIVIAVANSCVDGARYDACAVEKPQQNRWSNVKLV
jgi:hypothetical protein